MDQLFLHTFMSRFRYGVVSSTAADGTSHSALVGIAVTPDLCIVFDTLNTTRKYKNLIEKPRCSLVIGWDGEQTVQLEGLAIEHDDTESKTYRDAYYAVWPDGPARLGWLGIAYFVVHPTWIRYSDYDQSPPLIEEMTFPIPLST